MVGLTPWLRSRMAAEPQLAGLIERHGEEAIWFASVEVIGCPPTWNLGTESLLRMDDFLNS